MIYLADKRFLTRLENHFRKKKNVNISFSCDAGSESTEVLQENNNARHLRNQPT